MTDSLPPEAVKRLESILSSPETAAPSSSRLGCLALMRGLFTAAQLDEALAEQDLQHSPGRTPELLGQILIRRGRLDAAALEALLREQAALRAPFPRSDRFELQKPLGEGAFATVYQALDRTLGRSVALKILKVWPSLHETTRQRFRHEAQALARLSHPNVVAVHDFGAEGPCVYLVMELVPGKSLREVMTEGGGGLRENVELLRKVALGVHHAHEHGIVHRDLKPENILVTPAGEPKVADFGLAYMAGSAGLTRTGDRQGTPLYMSPEQVEPRPEAVGPRTDVYALGAILYEILTGRPPHAGDSLTEVYASILSREPVPPRRLNAAVRPDLETIALTALAKDPARRYPSAQAFAEDIRRSFEGEALWARPAGLPYRLYRRLRKNPAAYALGTVAAAALVVSVAAGIRTKSERIAAVEAIRDVARVSLEAALKFRRVGANHQMAEFLPKVEGTYRRAAERAPDLAEPDYLMGRMHRALLQETEALEFQERALGKDPDFVPALYERIVLLSGRYGSQFQRTYRSLQALKGPEVTAHAARQVPEPTPEDAERSRPDLLPFREQILRDCGRLDRLLDQGRGRWASFGVGESHALAARGILASHRGQYDVARKLLREAVGRDPLLEEAWEALILATWRRPAAEAQEKERDWEEVEAMASEAIGRDRGYVPHWIARSGARHLRGEARMKRGIDPSADLTAAVEDLNQALGLDPKGGLIWWMRGDVRLLIGTFQMSRGADPLSEFRAAEEDLTEALRRGSERTSPLRRRAIVRTRRGVFRAGRGEDPLPDFAAAESDLREALQDGRRNASLWDALGEVRLERGLYRARRTGDPEEDFTQAERDFTEALRFRRDSASAWHHRGVVRFHTAARRHERGEDPSSDLQGAEEDLSETLRLDDAQPPAWTARARTRLLRAAVREARGDRVGASSDCAASITDFEQVVRKDPSLAGSVDADLRRAKEKLDALRR